MFCKNCGNNVEDAAFCSVCGAPLETGASESASTPVAGEWGGAGKIMALISMILGIVSVAGGGITPAAIAGIILSILSNKKAAALGLSGDKKAKIGMTCSIIGLAIKVLTVVAAIVVLILYYVIIFAAIFGASGSY